MGFVSPDQKLLRITGAISTPPDKLPNASQHFVRANTLLDNINIEIVPDSLSLSQWAGKLRNQSYRGFCVGFGCTRALEIDNSALYGRKIDYLSPKNCFENAMLFDGLTSYRETYEKEHNVPWVDGTWVGAAAEGLKNIGVALEEDDPYLDSISVAGTKNSPPPKRMTDRYKILDYTTHYVGRAYKSADMTDQDCIDDLIGLLQYGSVALVIVCDLNFYFPNNPHMAIQPTTNNTVTDEHCICITGYDKNYGMDGNGGPGGNANWRNTAFSFDNSWGETYFSHWLSAEFILERAFDATIFHINNVLDTTPSSIQNKWAADVNDDSKINMADALIAIRQLTGYPHDQMPRFVKELIGWNKSNTSQDDIQDVISILRQAVGKPR